MGHCVYWPQNMLIVHAFFHRELFSQCGTVMRNIVVRATIKVNGKPQILGTRSPQTLNEST